MRLLLTQETCQVPGLDKATQLPSILHQSLYFRKPFWASNRKQGERKRSRQKVRTPDLLMPLSNQSLGYSELLGAHLISETSG